MIVSNVTIKILKRLPLFSKPHTRCYGAAILIYNLNADII